MYWNTNEFYLRFHQQLGPSYFDGSNTVVKGTTGTRFPLTGRGREAQVSRSLQYAFQNDEVGQVETIGGRGRIRNMPDRKTIAVTNVKLGRQYKDLLLMPIKLASSSIPIPGTLNTTKKASRV